MQLPTQVQRYKGALKTFKNRNADNLFSVNESRRNPYFNIVEKSRVG